MEILYLLIPLSVVLVFVIGAMFWWALKSGQFDDLEGPAFRVLMDDDRPQGDDEKIVPDALDQKCKQFSIKEPVSQSDAHRV
jgi:cbb3-type cytochrome oxidase maturation protein